MIQCKFLRTTKRQKGEFLARSTTLLFARTIKFWAKTYESFTGYSRNDLQNVSSCCEQRRNRWGWGDEVTRWQIEGEGEQGKESQVMCYLVTSFIFSMFLCNDSHFSVWKRDCLWKGTCAIDRAGMYRPKGLIGRNVSLLLEFTFNTCKNKPFPFSCLRW
jgi:hypothetical protein